MSTLGTSSIALLHTCHPDLQRLILKVSEKMDIKVICGTRSKEEQAIAFLEGRSKVQFPNSMHNTTPSKAVDIVPYPVDWNDVRRFYLMGGYVLATAEALGIRVRWGGDWNGNLDIKDQNFHDLPHIELVN